MKVLFESAAAMKMKFLNSIQVVTFDDITKEEGMAIHRPITCSLHGEEQPMKYFCNTCQILICNECMMTDHRQPGHQVERVGDIENREVICSSAERGLRPSSPSIGFIFNQCGFAYQNTIKWRMGPMWAVAGLIEARVLLQ